VLIQNRLENGFFDSFRKVIKIFQFCPSSYVLEYSSTVQWSFPFPVITRNMSSHPVILEYTLNLDINILVLYLYCNVGGVFSRKHTVTLLYRNILSTSNNSFRSLSGLDEWKQYCTDCSYSITGTRVRKLLLEHSYLLQYYYVDTVPVTFEESKSLLWPCSMLHVTKSILYSTVTRTLARRILEPMDGLWSTSSSIKLIVLYQLLECTLLEYE
jgi:hypothetical protein